MFGFRNCDLFYRRTSDVVGNDARRDADAGAVPLGDVVDPRTRKEAAVFDARPVHCADPEKYLAQSWYLSFHE